MNKKTFSFKVCFAAGFISTATVNVSPSQAWTVPEKPLVNSALVFDLDDNGIETAALNAKGSVYFDWDGDDFAEATAWLNTKDGFLVLDRNGNGYIQGGPELFGNNSGANGFDSLRKYDSNGDGKISAADKHWKDFRVWTDTDSDGFSDPEEKHTLDSLLITEINLGYTEENPHAPNALTRRQSYFLRQDGRESLISEIEFKVDWQNTKSMNLDTKALAWVFSRLGEAPDMRGYGLLRHFIYEATFQSSERKSTAFLETLEKLKDFKESDFFANNNNVMDLVEEIMYQWADVEHATPKEGFAKHDLRKIAFMEKWRGQPYSEKDLENLQKKNGLALKKIFGKTHNFIYTQIISQMPAGKSLLGNTDYFAESDSFSPPRKVNFEKVKELGKLSLTYADHESRKIFWQNVIRPIEYSVGIDNLKPAEIRLLEKTIQRSDPYLNLTIITQSLIPSE